MINLKDFRKNKDKYILSAKLRGVVIDFNLFYSLDKQITHLKKKIDILNREINKLTKYSIRKPSELEIETIKNIKDNIFKLETILKDKLKSFNEIYLKIPNIIDNELLTIFNNNKNITNNDNLNFEMLEGKYSYKHFLEKRLIVESNSNGIILKDWVVRLKTILIIRIFEKFEKKGFRNTNQFRFGNDNKISTPDQKIKLENFEEVEIYKNNIFYGMDLPERLILELRGDEINILDFNNCDRIIILSFLKNEDTKKEQKLISIIIEEIYEELGINFIKELLCINNLNIGSSNTTIINSYFIQYNKLIQTADCSNYLDYISRRYNIKYKEGNKSNYTGIVIGKINIMAILFLIIEFYQNIDLRVNIPNALKKYFNTDKL